MYEEAYKVVVAFGSSIAALAGLMYLLVAYKTGLLKALLRKSDEKETKEEPSLVDVLSQLRGEMSGLSGHFNHTTTGLLGEIRDEVKAANQKLGEFERHGIPCKK
jgi:hypothetical protein